jgi:hypothetical protein
MIKDRDQKKVALKLCAAREMLPALEVNVRSRLALSDRDADITDIDVLGTRIGMAGRLERTLFDCKATSKWSPINRALWAAGLRILTDSVAVYVIQRKQIDRSHKAAAAQLQAYLYEEKEFYAYATSSYQLFESDFSYAADMGRWDELASISKKFPALEQPLLILNSEVPTEREASRALRRCFAALILARGELNPDRREHVFFYGVAVSWIVLLVAAIANQMKELSVHTLSKAEFSKTLAYFVWGGREFYELSQRLRAAKHQEGELEGNGEPLRGWDAFVGLVRSVLDEPGAATSLGYLCREITWRAAGPKLETGDKRLTRFLENNNRARQFIIMTSRYISEHFHLPDEFAAALRQGMSELCSSS